MEEVRRAQRRQFELETGAVEHAEGNRKGSASISFVQTEEESGESRHVGFIQQALLPHLLLLLPCVDT